MDSDTAALAPQTWVRPASVSWRGRVALAAFVVGLMLVLAWRLVAVQAPVNHTFDSLPNSGRWTLQPFHGRDTDDAILVQFKKEWGHPAGSEKLIPAKAWKARMTALCALAKLGADAIPILLRGLDDNDDEVRDLSAQALGYFGDESVIERLDRAIREDPSPTVRIYAGIARGSIAGDLPDSLADDVLQHDPHSVVRARLELARLRGQPPRSTLARDGFAAFDLAQMDAAKLNSPAPDFELTDIDGKRHRLSDYRGKKDVVLVFVYGVTCMFCTGQVGNLRTKLDELSAMGTQVLVVEANEPYRVKATAKEGSVSKTDERLTVLADPAHTAAAKFGVAMQMNHIEWLNRPSTFVIDRQGILRRRILAANPSDRPSSQALVDEVKQIQASKPTEPASPDQPEPEPLPFGR